MIAPGKKPSSCVLCLGVEELFWAGLESFPVSPAAEAAQKSEQSRVSPRGGTLSVPKAPLRLRRWLPVKFSRLVHQSGSLWGGADGDGAQT